MEVPTEWDGTSQIVVQNLKALYMDRLRPLEIDGYFDHFHSAPLTASEIEARPQVLLVGQYSTGKTSLIRWITGIDSSFFDIRPQPSTDKFIAVVHGQEEKVISGDAATCLPELPYGGLSKFGSGFLSKFQVLVEPADILRQLSFVDTPGVLSGDKQRVSRGYDFKEVATWLASRCDLILLLFDAHKLDISDEFKEVIEAMRSEGDKCRCVLNKADDIDGENLVKVYGALMWNLGKILMTPEVARMYIGSFWDEEYKCKDLQRLLDQDRKYLMQELRDLPRNVSSRRVNEVVARARAIKVHLAVLDALKTRMSFFGCCRRRRREMQLVDQLPDIFQEVVKEHHFAVGDLPNIERFQERLRNFKDFRRFPWINRRKANDLNRLIEVDIPKLMGQVGGVSASGLQRTPEKNANGLAPLRRASISSRRCQMCTNWVIHLGVLFFTLTFIGLLVVGAGVAIYGPEQGFDKTVEFLVACNNSFPSMCRDLMTFVVNKHHAVSAKMNVSGGGASGEL